MPCPSWRSSGMPKCFSRRFKPHPSGQIHSISSFKERIFSIITDYSRGLLSQRKESREVWKDRCLIRWLSRQAWTMPWTEESLMCSKKTTQWRTAFKRSIDKQPRIISTQLSSKTSDLQVLQAFHMTSSPKITTCMNTSRIDSAATLVSKKSPICLTHKSTCAWS